MRTLHLALAGALTLGLSTPAAAEVWLKSWDAKGNPVQLRDLRGKVVALTFASRHTQEEATEVNDTLSENAGDDFQVLSVVDMMDIPDMGRGTARKKIAESDKPGLQHVVDDRGSLKRGFSTDPSRRVDILLIDKKGELRGRYNGLYELKAAQKEIEELRNE
jgi:cytochrome oxidase Cu insertion factor (SCO1/SenC/PrrC family)